MQIRYPHAFSAAWAEKLRARCRELATQDGLRLGQQTGVFCLVALLIFSRSPGQLLHAQFYAEDGKYWFQQAYNEGWLHALRIPYAGYLCTLQRLVASVSLLVPFRWAPLLMALAGLLVQCIPVTVLLSPRCRDWAPLPVRAVVAAFYVALPNTREIHVVLTNAPWHLAVAEVLVAFSRAPRTRLGRVGDVLLFAVGSLSGPFCILLTPMVLVFWWLRRQRWSLAQAVVMGAGALLQTVLLAHSSDRAPTAPLGAGILPLVRMVGGNIVTGLVFGGHSFLLRLPMWWSMLAAAVGVAICLYCLRFAGLELRLFVVYCWLLFAAALRSPVMGPVREPLWQALNNVVSCRYWFFPMLALVWCAVWCAVYARPKIIRTSTRAMLVLMVVGAAGNWHYGDYGDHQFAEAAKRFEHARPGELVHIAIAPNWSMDLVKKAP